MLKLSALREEAGLSQKELSKEAEVSVTSLNCWENGKAIPRLDKAVRVCKVLGCRIEDVREFDY